MSRETPARRSRFKVWRKFTTRWADNDAYGHVNNTIFYQWFDSAVNAWLVEQGMLDIESGRSDRAWLSRRAARTSRRSTFRRHVEIGLAVAELGRSSIRYRIGVFATEPIRRRPQGEFVHVVVDRATRRPVEMPPELASERSRRSASADPRLCCGILRRPACAT